MHETFSDPVNADIVQAGGLRPLMTLFVPDTLLIGDVPDIDSACGTVYFATRVVLNIVRSGKS
jgi:hypothetical protein